MAPTRLASTSRSSRPTPASACAPASATSRSIAAPSGWQEQNGARPAPDVRLQAPQRARTSASRRRPTSARRRKRRTRSARRRPASDLRQRHHHPADDGGDGAWLRCASSTEDFATSVAVVERDRSSSRAIAGRASEPRRPGGEPTVDRLGITGAHSCRGASARRQGARGRRARERHGERLRRQRGRTAAAARSRSSPAPSTSRSVRAAPARSAWATATPRAASTSSGNQARPTTLGAGALPPGHGGAGLHGNPDAIIVGDAKGGVRGCSSRSGDLRQRRHPCRAAVGSTPSRRRADNGYGYALTADGIVRGDDHRAARRRGRRLRRAASTTRRHRRRERLLHARGLAVGPSCIVLHEPRRPRRTRIDNVATPAQARGPRPGRRPARRCSASRSGLARAPGRCRALLHRCFAPAARRAAASSASRCPPECGGGGMAPAPDGGDRRLPDARAGAARPAARLLPGRSCGASLCRAAQCATLRAASAAQAMAPADCRGRRVPAPASTPAAMCG